MRIMHTADWHLGKRLEGRDRIAEQREVLAEIAGIAEREGVDVVIVAGDVFDTPVPSGEAETLFYDTVTALAAGGTRDVIVIGGNHDDVERVTAAEALASRQHIHLSGGADSLVIEKNGERAAFALLSYPSEARMAELERRQRGAAGADAENETADKSAQETMEKGAHETANMNAREAAIKDIQETAESGEKEKNKTDGGKTGKKTEEKDGEGAETFGKKVAGWFAAATKDFSPDKINIAVSHLFALGGSSGGDEREIELGGARLVDKSYLPNCDYVALGHLHKPQSLDKKRSIYYSGSILGYSFDEKTGKEVIIFDCRAGEGVSALKRVPLTSGKKLVTVKADGFEAAMTALSGYTDSYTSLELTLSEPLPDSENKTLRAAFPDLLKIRLILPDNERQEPESVRKLSKTELFRRFYQRETGGAEPPAELLELFLSLIEGGKGGAA